MFGRARPADALATVLFNNTTGLPVEITRIVVCNVDGTAGSVRIFHDDAGSTFDQTTALYYDLPVAANETITIEAAHAGSGFRIAPGGQLGVQSSVGNRYTYTAYGVGADIAPRS